jgi:DNA mismatch repair protein MutL
MPIQLLSPDVIAQIAAGEVVERPASVIKELVENSLDANATKIRISISGDGRKRLQVSDDGSGIPSSEIDLAFMRHATSKLRETDDLYRINTLGFRGEALASISAVSGVTLVTHHESDEQGTQIRIEGGELITRRSLGAPNGSTITVENLFFNTPARLKFMKSEASEKRQISAIISRYAMAYPFVRFTLDQDGREAFRTNGRGELLDVMVSALGVENLRQMFEVNDSHLNIHVYGYTSAPNYNRSDRGRITLFVNGRWVQDSSITHAVVQAYHTLLMTGRYPVAVLMLSVPPEDVDVNVHPTKAEVRFRDPDAVFSAVQRAVRRAVINNAQSPEFRDTRFAGTASQVWTPERDSSQALVLQNTLGLDLHTPGQHARPQSSGESIPTLSPSTSEPDAPESPVRPRTLPLLRVVGQVAASYIIAEGPAGMYLIDQHAAHERVLYEQFLRTYESQQPLSQHTLEAQTVQFPPQEASLLLEHLPSLSSLGFIIEPFGLNIFLIRALPAILADVSPVDILNDVVSDLLQGNKPTQLAVEARLIMRVCKRAAVKAGQILSIDQMQNIIRQLERCDTPLTCPHGRPTMIHMSSDQLAREFGRLGA